MEKLTLIDKCASKITSSSLIYSMCALRIMQRFKLSMEWNNKPPRVCYKILNYYVNNIDEDFEEWLLKNDAPLVRPLSHLRKIFPELVLDEQITIREIVDLANKIYGVDLHICDNEYIYSYSFDFNSFKPIPVKEIHDIKQKIRILNKYDVDTSALKAQINKYGLPDEIVRCL